MALATIGLALQLGVEVIGDRYLTVAVVRDQIDYSPDRPDSHVLAAGVDRHCPVRYRLWDIDLILHRALVYGRPTTTIVGVYAVVVSGVGAALALEGSPVVSLLAATVVALLFQPLRIWFQRAANRLMYGERDDPYAVMSSLSRQLSAALAQRMGAAHGRDECARPPEAAVCGHRPRGR